MPDLGSIGALLLGAMIVALGLYARRGGHLRHRQGAEVLVGFVVVTGVTVMLAGAALFAQRLFAVY